MYVCARLMHTFSYSKPSFRPRSFFLPRDIPFARHSFYFIHLFHGYKKYCFLLKRNCSINIMTYRYNTFVYEIYALLVLIHICSNILCVVFQNSISFIDSWYELNISTMFLYCCQLIFKKWLSVTKNTS